MATESEHPTPWRVGDLPYIDIVAINDANGDLIMVTGRVIGERIVTAVNAQAARGELDAPKCGRTCGKQGCTEPCALPDGHNGYCSCPGGGAAPARGEAPNGPDLCCDFRPTGPAPGAQASQGEVFAALTGSEPIRAAPGAQEGRAGARCTCFPAFTVDAESRGSFSRYPDPECPKHRGGTPEGGR